MSSVSAKTKLHQIDGVQLAKTRLCLFYQDGRCKYGAECTYAHTVDEVRKAPEELRKTKFCELFMDPSLGCVDPDCNFAHDVVELRSKKDARRKARASLRTTPSRAQAPRLSQVQVSSDAVELMQQLAALLAAVQQEEDSCLDPSSSLSTPSVSPATSESHSLFSAISLPAKRNSHASASTAFSLF